MDIAGVAKETFADLVAPEFRGTAYSMYNAFTGLALPSASLVFGYLTDRHGLRLVPFASCPSRLFDTESCKAAIRYGVMNICALTGPSILSIFLFSKNIYTYHCGV